MSTATMSGTKFETLTADIERIERERRQKYSELRDYLDAQLQGSSVKPISTSVGTVSKASTTSTTSAPTGKRRGRKPNSAKAVTGDSVKPNERNYTNDISLREAIWQVLDMGPKKWAELLPELPADVEGLKVTEIYNIIQSQGLWKSNADSFNTQLSTHLSGLKSDGKVARGADRRYYIVEGAEL